MDVCGMVAEVGDCTVLQLKNGRDTQKRSLKLRDDSNAEIELTLWGEVSGGCRGKGWKKRERKRDFFFHE